MLNAIIPKACKKWPRNGKSQVFKKALLLAFMNFLIINIEKFSGINFAIAIIFTSSFILQIVNILVLLFWNLCVLDKLRYCFLKLKGHSKLIKNDNHYSCWYQCYYKWHFYHYFHILHYRWINWITWTYTHWCFPFPFDCKSSYRKTKIIRIDLSPLRKRKHTHTTAPSFKKYFVKWWFISKKNVLLKISHVGKYQVWSLKHQT